MGTMFNSRKPRVLTKAAGGSLAVVCALALAALLTWRPAPVARADEGDGDDISAQVARLHELQASFHEAASYNGDPLDAAEHLELLATLWAPDATVTVGGNTTSGRDAIVRQFANGAPYHHDWISLAPSFRTRLDPQGDTADVYFECIYVDPATNMVVLKRSLFGTAKKVLGDWV